MPHIEGQFTTALQSAKTSEQILQLLKPYVRSVVEQADPEMLDVFDSAYEDGAADGVNEIIRGRTEADVLSGEQALGLNGQIAASIVAFMINIAATITVARMQATNPNIWNWLTGASTSSVITDSVSDPIDAIVTHSGLPVEEQKRLSQAIRNCPEIMLMLKSVKRP